VEKTLIVSDAAKFWDGVVDFELNQETDGIIMG